MPVVGITSLCTWERHLTLISQTGRVLCERGAVLKKAGTPSLKASAIEFKFSWFFRGF